VGDILSLPPLSAFQRPIFYDDRHWLLIAGRRSGKSGVALLRGVKIAMRGGQVSWSSASKDLAQAGWQDTIEFCKPYATRVAAAEDGIMEFYDPQTGRTGSIQRRSAYGVSSGRAYTFDLVIIDEVQMTDQSFFKRIIPSLLTTGGKICLLGTPPETPAQIEACDWIKDMLDRPLRYKDWLITHKPTRYQDIAFYMAQRDGNQKTRKEYEAITKESLKFLKQNLGDDDYEREIEAKWPTQKVGGRVYKAFSLDKHCTPEMDYSPEAGPIFWVIDRGEGVALTVVLLCQLQKDKLIVFCEEVSRELVSEETMVNRALQLDYPLPEIAIYDPRAPGYMLALSGAGLPCAPGAGRDLFRGIGIVKKWISRDRIGVNPRCLVTLSNFEKYKLNPQGIPLDKENDALDALRYLVRYLAEQSGEPWSEEEESRSIVVKRGGGLDYGAVIEVHF